MLQHVAKAGVGSDRELDLRHDWTGIDLVSGQQSLQGRPVTRVSGAHGGEYADFRDASVVLHQSIVDVEELGTAGEQLILDDLPVIDRENDASAVGAHQPRQIL